MFDDTECRPVSPSSMFEDHHLFAPGSRQKSVDTVVSTPPANHYPHITEDHQAFKYLQQLRANALSAAIPCGLANECHREGSLFSIHSAPPVPLADNTCHAYRRDSRDPMAAQQSRPVSLALDPNAMLTVQFAAAPVAAAHSSRAVDLPPMPSDEADDEENENLWTVSSLTARPLIAKSKELRNIRFIGKSSKAGGGGGGGRTKKSGASSGRATAADDGTSVGGLSKGSGSDCTAIDGGYGWLVVFGAFSVQFWVAGLVKSYGVLYVEIMESFPNASAGK